MILYLLSLIRRCPGLPDDRHFVKLVGRQDKVILVLFYTNLQLLAKLVTDSILSQSNFWICGHSILNHSRNAVQAMEVPSKLAILLLQQNTMSHPLDPILLSLQSQLQNLIGFNRKLRGELKKWRHWHRVCWAKSWSWNDENAFDFRRSDVQEENEEDIAKISLDENQQKQANEVFSHSKSYSRSVWLLRNST